jgi:hypothetical protein
MQLSSVGGALACCMAGPSSNLKVRHPMEVFATERAMKKIERELGGWISKNVRMYCMNLIINVCNWKKDKINIKKWQLPPNL